MRPNTAPFLCSVILSAIPLLCTGCTASWRAHQVYQLPQAEPITALVSAHRAAADRSWPENSLHAIQHAAAAGVPLVEVDVRMSRSGTLFLFHDSTVQNSNTASPGALLGRAIEELTDAERGSLRLPHQEDVRIPLLREALALLKTAPLRMQLDIKGESDAVTDAVIAQIFAAGAQQRVIIQFRDVSRLRRVLEKYPMLHTLARCKNAEDLSEALAVGSDMVELEGWATAGAIQAAHAVLVPVLINVAHPFFDVPQVWEMVRARGFDIIMTNHAAQQLQLLKPTVTSP